MEVWDSTHPVARGTRNRLQVLRNSQRQNTRVAAPNSNPCQTRNPNNLNRKLQQKPKHNKSLATNKSNITQNFA